MRTGEYRFLPTAILALFIVAARCWAADHDFFELSRYPVEGKLRPWAELRRARQEGNDPQEYNRRTVHWWPRKGVDFTELRDGMIEREWSLAASAMDPACKARVMGEVEIEELDSLSFTPNAGDSFLRRVRGYITPGESGLYMFKIAADNDGYVYLSTDEDPANARAVCYQKMRARHLQWNRWPTQMSKPLKLEKGKKYYYEIAYADDRWRDHCDIAWSSDTRPEQMLKGDEFSTLDGRKGKFVVEKWQVHRTHGHPRPPGVPRKFKAHLVGFMGLGNELGEPYQGEEIVAPGVVLRFADGRKRVLHRWLLSEEDQRFAMDLYVKEMKRIKASLDQTEYTWGEESPPLGRDFYVSPHFVFNVAAHPEGEDPEATALRDKFYRSALAGAEYWYAYLEYGGHLMQYWDRKAKRKHRVHVGGGNGGGYGGCTIGGITALPIALFHEYSHGFYLWWFGHPEIFCDFGQDLGTGGAANKNRNNVRRPHRSALNGAYPTCLFLSTLGEDPNWGYCAVTSMPKADSEQNFFQTLARLAEQRGMCKKGIPGAGDIVAEYGARLAEFDFQNRNLLRRSWHGVVKQHLEAIDVKNGEYRITWDWAPEMYGTDVVRLVGDPDSKEITVDFHGYHDPTVYSDWRACIVAVGKDGECRYSDFWNKGVMTMPRQEGDRRYWLTVTAAPTGILNIRSPLRICSGRWCPVYPWRITLKGARPGTPRRLRFDCDDYYASNGPEWPVATIHPTPPNTPARKLFVEKTREAREAVLRKIKTAQDPYVRHLLMGTAARMDHALDGCEGAPHPNGGGWVADTATVAPTAYVAPGAMVMGFAKVLDDASVEEYAIVRGNAELSGNARVGGESIIEGTTRLSGYRREWCPDGKGEFHGLWHNYALDEKSVMMLEDRFREYGIKNGYVCDRPGLIVDEGRRAFEFDGKKQYLELNSRAADLDEITVDMAVKPARPKRQTLWDFGSDAENRMTLKINARGTPVFTATVAGKETVTLPVKVRMARDAWTRLRVEIDGKRIALWVNDKLSASTASTFRPADAFPSGLQKRNFVAASRDGNEHFAGAIDYVVIYHHVHGAKFTELPPPVMDASCRPTQRFANEMLVDRAARKRYEIENNHAVEEAMVHYSKLAADIYIRLHELRNRDPNWRKAIAKAKEDLANIDKLAKEAGATEEPEQPEPEPAKEVVPPPKLAELRKEREALQEKIVAYAEKERECREGEAEWIKTIEDEEYPKLMAERKAGEEKVEALRKEAEASFETMPETVETKKKIAALTAERAELDDVVKEVNEAVEKAVAAMPVYWDSPKIEAEVRFMRGLDIRYEGELGGGGGGSIQAWRAQQERRKHMAKKPGYKRAMEIDLELRVLKALGPIHRDMHFAKAKEYNELREKMKGEESPGHKANQIMAKLKEQRRQKILGPEYDELQQRRGELDREINSLQREYDQARRRQEKEVRRKREAAKRKREEPSRRRREERRAEIRQELFDAYNKAVEPCYAEYHIGVSYLRSAIRGFYNTPYSHHFRGQGLVKKNFRYRDTPGDMGEAIGALRPENWATDVRAWDWRTRWERDGSIAQFPMTQQWLRRVRGDGPINIVDGR